MKLHRRADGIAARGVRGSSHRPWSRAIAFIHAALVMLCTCGFIPAAFAQTEDACIAHTETANNRDGSSMWIERACEAGMPHYTVRFLAPHASNILVVGHLDEGDMLDEPFRSAGFIDLDGDGMHEVEARGGCGAGPNCMGAIYRLAPGGKSLEMLFSGGYADVRLFEGYLVESGRASCCSWEYHAWKIDRTDLPLEYDTMDLMITIGADLASDDADAPARCTFSRRSGDNWEVVAPPGRAWHSLCEVYGDYHLVTPEEARTARAAQEQ